MVMMEAKAPKRTIVIGLKRGDDLLASVNAAIEKFGIKQGAIVSGIAALGKATFHKVTDFSLKAKNEFITIEAPIELSSMQGTIIDGAPHIHMAFADDKGNAFSGHLEPGCEVLYVGEIVILEFEGGNIARKPNEHGLMLIAEAD